MNFRVIFFPSSLHHSAKPPHLKGVAFTLQRALPLLDFIGGNSCSHIFSRGEWAAFEKKGVRFELSVFCISGPSKRKRSGLQIQNLTET